MQNINQLKIPIFSNINDVPRSPTAELAGNGADVIARYNSLIDALHKDFSPIQSNIAFYVDPVNGNDTGSGFQNSPFATLAHASRVAAGMSNPDRYSRTIILQPGTHNGALLTGFLNCGTDDFILIQGGGAQNSDVIIDGVDCLSFASSGIYKLNGLTLNGTTSLDGNCLCINNARIKIGSVSFGTANNNHIVGFNHATIEVLANYEIIGNAGISHIHLDSFSFLDTSCLAFPTGRTITLTALLQIADFALLKRNSYLSALNTSFSGSATGRKFNADASSIIEANAADFSLFPGDVAGVLTRNSQYI